MNGSIYGKLEIDVMQVNELHEAAEVAYKYNLPALVVHHGLSSEAIIAKNRVGAKFKIITPIDWPKGETFGTTKMRGLTTDALEADGFEILLTPNKSVNETKNEATAITEFIRRHIGPQVEIRFVLGCQTKSEEEILNICQGLVGIRTPTLLRTDTQIKVQVSKANVNEHNRHISTIQSIIKAPVKVSGNINNLKCATECDSASRFAVNLVQAKTIIKEFKSQPLEVVEMLDQTDPS